jgi:hypothetical protein
VSDDDPYTFSGEIDFKVRHDFAYAGFVPPRRRWFSYKTSKGTWSTIHLYGGVEGEDDAFFECGLICRDGWKGERLPPVGGLVATKLLWEHDPDEVVEREAANGLSACRVCLAAAKRLDDQFYNRLTMGQLAHYRTALGPLANMNISGITSP